VASANKIYECREKIAGYFSSDHPENVVFTMNTTYAINMAIKGLLRRGDHVLISDMEHNSVYRPIEKLFKDGFITYSVFNTVKNGSVLDNERILRSISKLIRPGRTKMLICSHVPNICSAVRPISAIGSLCREKGIIFVLDAAQSAGHIPINVKGSSVDVLCAPAHKGLYGIQGCGFMLLGDKILPKTILEGGNGINSLDPEMHDFSPERFEAGTLATPCIAGLSAGIRAVMEKGVEEISVEEKYLISRLRDALGSIKGVDVYAPWYDGSILLFNVRGIGSEVVASQLDRRGICVRGGYHCAGLAHKTLGTPEGGAVRVSVGTFNKLSEADTFARELLSIVRSKL
jgi:selenocysteine lyase/cysteine desulfurase